MTQINLLPWREQTRKIKKLRFAALTGMFVGLTLILVIIIHLVMSAWIHSQENDNDFLQAQLTKEQAAVYMLLQGVKIQNTINTQLHYVFSLQDESYKAVRLLDALNHVVPDNVLLIKVIRNGDKITLVGRAQSNLQVTLLMKNIIKAKIFNQPILTEIKEEKEGNNENQKYFQLDMTQQE